MSETQLFFIIWTNTWNQISNSRFISNLKETSMYKITQNDIQHIEDENALIGFLKEKLNLPIPEDLTLAEISSKFSNFALGLSEFHSKQVLDCQELSLSPGTPSGIFLIRFKSEPGYSGVLHAIAKGLEQRGNNTTDLRFICMDENFQSFAFAYFKNSARESRESTELNIFAWTQDNTKIHIASEHEIPADFLPDASIDRQDDESKNHKVMSISTEDLLEKLENVGIPLSTHYEIHKGITKGCNKAFVIDEPKRRQLIREDPKSAEIIKLGIGKHQKSRWKPILKHLIWIPSSKIKQWQWSDARNESEAKKIFAGVYPAISNHLHRFEIDIKSRHASSKGKFYWELSPPEHYPEFVGPKIIFYNKPPILAFYDESDAIVVNSFVHSIQTTDLSLLAILNSKFFKWYAQKKYKTKGGWRLNKTNLKNFPIAGTEAQKVEISDIVELILDDPDSPDAPALEEEVDKLVYDLYELTPAEITLIEKESSK